MQLNLQKNVIYFSKNSWASTNAKLSMTFICKLFQSWLHVGQFKLHGVSPILFMSRRLRCLLRMCSTCLKPYSLTKVVGNASNNSLTFSKVRENTHCTWIRNLFIRVYIGVGRKGQGASPPCFFNFRKRGCFLSFAWKKRNFTTFDTP